MVKAGKYWKWPHLEDQIFFQKQNVQKKLYSIYPITHGRIVAYCVYIRNLVPYINDN